MKKSIFVNAAIIALAMLASCQKEQFTENVTPVTGVTEFTATIEQPTKTAIAADGKVTWVAGDTITVKDADSKSAVYVAGSDGASTTFTLREGETAVGAGPYSATYGDIANQIYDAAGANCPLTAAATSTTTFKFSSPYAVVKITAKSDGGEVIDSVGVSYGEKTYTLDCGEGVTLTSDGNDFFVAVEPATDAVALSATFHTADKSATKERTSAVALAAKDLLPVTLIFTADDWESSEADLPDGALKGVFTVGNGADGIAGTADDIKVHFSQGNLYCSRTSSETTDWTWHFYGKQYQFNSIPTTDEMRTAQTSDTEIDLFTWGYSQATSLFPVGYTNVPTHLTNGAKLVYDKASSEGGDDWGVAYCNSNNIAVGTWRTLSTAEWQYLFNTRTFDGSTGEGYSYQRAKINSDIDGGVYGMILYHDNYTGTAKASYTSDEWVSLENAGCVFLPAAGRRDGSNVTNVGGFYWSSAASGENYACRMYFDSYGVYPGDNGLRHYGFSVRLVTDVSAAPTPTEPAYVEITAKYDGEDHPARTLKWYRQNLAITGSGNNPWKGKNPSAVKVPGTDKDVIVGDYFQWAAYENYALPENDLGNGKTDKGLLIYTSFTNQFCVGGGDEDKFVFKMAEQNKEYYFNPSFPKDGYVCISPYYSDSYTKYTSGSVNLDSSDDVASIILGGEWRMPTSDEFEAMTKATYWAWDSDDCGYYVYAPQEGDAGKKNYEQTSGHTYNKSDALLFFPAAGYGSNSEFTQASVVGYYWSGTLSDDTNAHCLDFNNNDVHSQGVSSRSYGNAVRPVSD